jgi:large subunit ribosomal protein L5
MNRINYYANNQSLRDFILKTNPKNILNLPKFSKIVLHTTIQNNNIELNRSTDRLDAKQPNHSIPVINLERKKIIIPFLALEMISGQKPIKTRSKQFIAGFKIKKDQLLGYKVTLRGFQMFSFFEKFVTIVLPKLRDFQGFLSSSLQNHGHISLGFQNFLLFPEIEAHYEIFEALSGLHITFVTKSFSKRSKFAKQSFAKQSCTNEILLFLSMYQIPTSQNN